MPLIVHCPKSAAKLKPMVSVPPKVFERKFLFPESLGDFISTGDTAHDRFASTLDGDPVVLTYDNFTIQTGHTVTPTNRCKGLYLNILGDLIVDGTLSMTARGANAPGKWICIGKWSKEIYYVANQTNASGLIGYDVIGATGGGANAAAINKACGGGGSGGNKGGAGSAGTSFSGGAGGGGGNGSVGGAGAANGGKGGNGVITSGGGICGGGAGNPGGTGAGRSGATAGAAHTGTAGTGGLLILFVAGNVIVNGSIQANGSKGGNGFQNANFVDVSGGGSGGGSIHLFHSGDITGTTKITATGGAAGATSVYAGRAGGKGTVNIAKV